MGTDFNYMNANSWYKNLDKLMHYVNLDGRVNVFYSTPTLYTRAKNSDTSKLHLMQSLTYQLTHSLTYTHTLTLVAQVWPTKSDDWFPYADLKHGKL
jgi:alpha-mannosidase